MNKKVISTIFIIVACIALGLSVLRTPTAKGTDTSNFSATRAANEIKQFATEPHAVTQQESLKKVRDYLLNRLTELGLEPTTFTYKNISDKYGWTYDINNIYAKIDGKNGENGSYILLAAHYDSSPKKRVGEEDGSHGAADDGYGLSTILEVIHHIQESKQPLENGIKILFTDAEETGLLGANLEMQKNRDLYKNVNFVINLEARGIKGPAVMFETNKNNLKTIELYKHANLPMSYSLATDVYQKMPNGSDFTEFANAGIPGINFAVLDNLDYYHTKLDNPDNISDRSIQHYGEQVLPIVKEYVYNEKYSDLNVFDSKENMVYFTFLPNLIVSYSHTTAIILAIIAVALTTFSVLMYRNKYQVSIKNVGKWTGLWILFALAAMITGVAISYILSIVFDIPFKLTYMPKIPFDNTIMIVAIVGFIALMTAFVRKNIKTGACTKSIVLGGMLFNTLLLIVFMIVLPGGSFLFLWPVMLFSIFALGNELLKKFKKTLPKIFILLPVMFTIMIYVPIVYLLHIALTIGALGVVLFLAMASIAIIVPCIAYYVKK
ncbi:MAG: M20/M25/M40 family metallo-hydrolase [Bacillaceae bacterium]